MSYGADGALANRDAVSAAQLPQLAAQSFPLCMHHMYGHVRSAHHLHHQGRLQLGLFLKVGPLACHTSAHAARCAESDAHLQAPQHAVSRLQTSSKWLGPVIGQHLPTIAWCIAADQCKPSMQQQGNCMVALPDA